VQNIPSIPDDIKQIFKTAYEMSQKSVMMLAADRGQFVCQSQSLNIHMKAPKIADLVNVIRLGVKLQLKTISYYVRRYAAQKPEKFGLVDNKQADVCTRDNPNCESCGI